METKPKVKLKDVSLITILSRVNNVQCQQWKHYINVVNGFKIHYNDIQNDMNDTSL